MVGLVIEVDDGVEDWMEGTWLHGFMGTWGLQVLKLTFEFC